MSRTAITADALTATGYNLTDSADYVTMTPGGGNGVEIAFNARYLLALKNDTVGSATFTFDVPVNTDYSAKGVTIPDATVVVGAGDTHLYVMSAIFKQTDGDVYVDCDVAGKILVLVPPA